MKSLPNGWATDLRKLHGGQPYIWLYEISITDSPSQFLRLAQWADEVQFESQTFYPWPIGHQGGGEDSTGRLDPITLTASNVTRELQAFLEYYNYLSGRTVRIIQIKSDAPGLSISETYSIISAVANQSTVTFTMGARFLVAGANIGRRLNRDMCAWVYKSADCGYAGIITTCDKTLADPNGCRAHNNAARFGGAPGIPQGQVIIR